jgi:hypothetical protein
MYGWRHQARDRVVEECISTFLEFGMRKRSGRKIHPNNLSVSRFHHHCHSYPGIQADRSIHTTHTLPPCLYFSSQLLMSRLTRYPSTLVRRNTIYGTPDSSGELQVLGHDCDALSVNSTQIAVLEEMH